MNVFKALIICVVLFTITSCVRVTPYQPETTAPVAPNAPTEAQSTTAESTTKAESTEAEATDTSEEETSTEPQATETEPATTVTEEEPVTDPSTINHIALWRSYPDTDSGTLRISSVSDTEIAFVLNIVNGEYIVATAVRQGDVYAFGESISPEWEYSHYIVGTPPQNGVIELCSDGVRLTYEDGSVFFGEVKTENYNQKRSALESTIRKSLSDKGWLVEEELFQFDISIMDYFVGAKEFYGEGGQVVPVCSIAATSGELSAAVRLMYDRYTDSWLFADAFYANMDGKILQGEDLTSFMARHGKADMILSAEDADLVAYLAE